MSQPIFRALPVVNGKCKTVIMGTDASQVIDHALAAAAHYGVRFAVYEDAELLAIFPPTVSAKADPILVGRLAHNLGISPLSN